MFLEAISKFEEILLKETLEIAEKRRKIQKNPIFLTRCSHGHDLQKVNDNTSVIARMLLIVLENFMNIGYRGKN